MNVIVGNAWAYGIRFHNWPGMWQYHEYAPFEGWRRNLTPDELGNFKDGI